MKEIPMFQTDGTVSLSGQADHALPFTDLSRQPARENFRSSLGVGGLPIAISISAVLGVAVGSGATLVQE